MEKKERENGEEKETTTVIGKMCRPNKCKVLQKCSRDCERIFGTEHSGQKNPNFSC